MFGFFNAGGIGGVGDIETNRHIRLEPVGDHTRAITTNFLLDTIGSDDGDGKFGLLFGQLPHDLGDDKTAHAVVDGTATKPAFSEFLESIGIDAGVADAQSQLGDFLVGVRSDIDVQLVHLGGFFAAGPVPDMNGGVADDPFDGAMGALKNQLPAAGRGIVTASNTVNVDKAFLGDILDHVADFVGMSFQHQFHGGIPFQHRPGAAVGVVLDAVAKGLHVAGPHPLPSDFKAGGAGGAEELIQKRFGRFVHILSDADARRPVLDSV